MNTEAQNYLNFRDEGCDYIDMKDMESRVHPETIPKYPSYVAKMRQPIGDAFNIPSKVTRDLELVNVQLLADSLICMQFEGHSLNYGAFDDETWHTLRQMQVLGNTTLKGQDCALYSAKLVEYPMDIIKYKVARLLGRVEPIPVYDQLKLLD